MAACAFWAFWRLPPFGLLAHITLRSFVPMEKGNCRLSPSPLLGFHHSIWVRPAAGFGPLFSSFAAAATDRNAAFPGAGVAHGRCSGLAVRFIHSLAKPSADSAAQR